MRTLVLAFAVLPVMISFGAHGQPVATAASAQDYPQRPLRAIVPIAPGGGSDISSRIVATALTQALGQQVIVDNRPGGGGRLGVAIAARALPDGYTVLMGNIATHGISPALFKDLPYDVSRDFAPVSMLGTTPSVLVVHPSVPAATMREFIAHAKANPGKIRYASSGVGGANHLAIELLKSLTGTDMLHVPYKGTGAAQADLLSGVVQVTSASLAGQLPYIKSGKLRALAVTTAQRNAKLPDVPTVIESGISGYEVTIWYAMFVPAAVPKPIIAKLNAELVRLLNAPELKTRLGQIGIDAVSSTPAELAAFVKADVARWTRVVKIAGIQPES